MKLRPAIGWSLLLLLTHGVVFMIARPAASSHGEVGKPATAAADFGPPAKFANRERLAPKPSSVHAGLMAELNASDMEGEEYERAFAVIYREWIKRDLRGALGFAFGPESGDRNERLARSCDDELEREILAQGVQVGQWICSGYFGSRNDEAAMAWAEAMVAGQRREIVLAALPDLPGPARSEVVDELCMTAKAPELALLRRWMNPEEQGRLDEYAQRIVRFTGEDPAKIFATENNPEVIEALCDAYRGRYLDHLPGTEALVASLKLPESYREDCLESIAGSRSGGLAGFTAILAEMDHRALWDGLSAECEAEMIDAAISANCTYFSSPSEVFTQLGVISRESTRLIAMKKAGELMGGAEKHALAAAVEALPGGPERDAFIAGLQHRMGSFDEEPEARLLACVSDPGLRAKLQLPVTEEADNDDTILPPPPAE